MYQNQHNSVGHGEEMEERNHPPPERCVSFGGSSEVMPAYASSWGAASPPLSDASCIDIFCSSFAMVALLKF
jgi:hypothetical protein